MATTYSHFPIRRLLLQSNSCKELSVSAGKIIRKEKCARLFCSPAVNTAVEDEVKKPPRKKRMSTEEREEAVKSFVQQYTLRHPGKFPTYTLVKEEVGGSWGTLKQILTKLEANSKSSQDQKQLTYDNGGALEAVKFVEPENLPINAKSNDAIITDSINLKQETPVSCEKLSDSFAHDSENQKKLSDSLHDSANQTKLSDSFAHDSENQTSSVSSKEEPVAQSFSAVSSQKQDPSESSKEGLVAESAAINLLTKAHLELGRKHKMNAHKVGKSLSPSHPKGLSGTDLPDSPEQTAPESLKEIPGAISGTELPRMSAAEAAGEKLEEIGCKEASSSVAYSFVEKLSSVKKQLKKLEVESLTVGPTVKTPDSNHSIQSPKVGYKQVGNGSDKSENISFLGRSASRVETNTDTSIIERIKKLGQERRKQNFSFKHSFVSRNGSDDEKEDDSDFSAEDYPEPDGRAQLIIPRTNFRSEMPDLPEKPKNHHCVQLMFLPPAATEHDICMAFSDCGSITEARIFQSRREHSNLNYASIKFKTKEGFEKALTKKDVVISGSDVVVEATFSDNHRLSQDLTPRVEENKSMSPTEMKNPRCTVMIKDLPDGLNLKHLKNALAFCGTISSVSMGSSNSAVFVEFETEEAKERALMAHWISIDGQQLQTRRVDAPRTPVVRISNVSPETGDKKILHICKSFGQAKRVHRRDKDIVDVHFKHTQLGCMPSILDSLNGVIMANCHWQAQPAPVFPPQTLQALWSSAEGKEYLHSVMQNLCRIINRDCFDTDDVNEIAAQYYGE